MFVFCKCDLKSTCQINKTFANLCTLCSSEIKAGCYRVQFNLSQELLWVTLMLANKNTHTLLLTLKRLVSELVKCSTSQSIYHTVFDVSPIPYNMFFWLYKWNLVAYLFWDRSRRKYRGPVWRTGHTAKGEKSAFLRTSLPSPSPHTITHKHRRPLWLPSNFTWSTSDGPPLASQSSYRPPLVSAVRCQ